MGIKCVVMPPKELVDSLFDKSLDGDSVSVTYEVPIDFSTNMGKYAVEFAEQFYGVMPITCVVPVMDVVTNGKYDGRKFTFDVTWLVVKDEQYPLAVVGTAYTPGFPKLTFAAMMTADYALLMGMDGNCVVNCVRSGCRDTSKCDVELEQVGVEKYLEVIRRAINDTTYEFGLPAQQSSTQLQQVVQQPQQQVQAEAPTAQQPQAQPQEQPQQQVAQQQSAQPQQAPVEQSQAPTAQPSLVEVAEGVYVEDWAASYFNMTVIRNILNSLSENDPIRYQRVIRSLPQLMRTIAYIVGSDPKYKDYPDTMKVYIATRALVNKIIGKDVL